MISRYKSSDIKEIAELFYNTVHFVNSKDYSPEQVNVWASGKIDQESWDTSFLSHYTLVARIDGVMVGFGDIDATGYLDRLYVHKDFQNQGIGNKICDELEKAYQVMTITTHASITARPFFEKRGYRVVREQQVLRSGVSLTNFVMEKCMENSFKK